MNNFLDTSLPETLLKSSRNVITIETINWPLVIVIAIVSVCAIFFLNILVIFIVKQKNSRKKLFKEIDRYYGYHTGTKNEQNQDLHNYHDWQSHVNSSVSEYILYNNDLTANHGYSLRVFIPYQKKLRDDYLINNWWLY
ncbi:MAG: hypothetical protein ACRCVI_01785 [Mycoplasmoidaceae bacterium]